MIASDSVDSSEDAFHTERRCGARDQSSINTLLVILGLQSFDFLAPIVIGYVCYVIHDASGPTFWSVCGKFCVIAAVLGVLVFRLSGCYSRDICWWNGTPCASS